MPDSPVDTRFLDAIQALMQADHGDPFSVLGPQAGADGGWQVRVLFPDARRLTIIDRESGDPLAEAERAHEGGFWLATLPGPPRPYRLEIDLGGTVLRMEDAYRFGPWLGELDRHLLGEGSHQRPWERLGAQCPAGFRGRGFLRLGRAAPAHAPASRPGPVGDLRAPCGPGRCL